MALTGASFRGCCCSFVSWDLDGRHTHIGMVVNQTNFWGRNKVLHNIGEGPKIEDVLFDWKITGHYRYYGPKG